MAEIEKLAHSGFLTVIGDDHRLHLDRFGHNFQPWPAPKRVGRKPFDRFEKLVPFDDRGLEHFGQTLAHLSVRKRLQRAVYVRKRQPDR